MDCSRRFETSQDSKLFGHLSVSMGDLQQRDARRVEFVGKRGITGRRKYADLLYCIPQRNRCRGCEITDSGGILRGVRKNLGAIVFDFSDGSGMGRTVDELKKLCPDADWKVGKMVNGASERELADWANKF